MQAKLNFNQEDRIMAYQAVYKDSVGKVVTESVEGNYGMVWDYCVLKTVDSVSREFLIVEVKEK